MTEAAGISLIEGNYFQRLLPLVRTVRLTPFDVSTPDGRDSERYRRIALSASASLLSKIVSALAIALSVPLTLHYLGPEKFGVWMTISSFVAFLSFIDLGIGNGIMSEVARASGQQRWRDVSEISSSGLAFLVGIGATLTVSALALRNWIDWSSALRISDAHTASEAANGITALCIFIAISFPLSVVQKIQIGLQEGYLANVWQCVASMAALAALFTAIAFRGGLPWLVAATMGAPAAVLIANWVWYWPRLRSPARPRPSNVRWPVGILVVSKGSLFLILQISGAVAFASDSLIISRVLGPSQVPAYAIPEKLFSVASMAIAIALGPFWPAYSEALAKGDAKWVVKAYRRTLIGTSIAVTIYSISLLLIGPRLIDAWVGVPAYASFSVLLGLAIWKIVEAIGNSMALFLNGAHVIRPQAVAAVVMAGAAIALKIWFVRQFGVAGIAFGTTLAYVCFALPVGIYLSIRVLRELMAM